MPVVAEAAAFTTRTVPVSVSTSTSAAHDANVQNVDAMGYDLPSGPAYMPPTTHSPVAASGAPTRSTSSWYVTPAPSSA